MSHNYVKCSNYGRLGYEHYILESSSEIGKYFDRLCICAICRKVAFTDNFLPTTEEPVRRGAPYRDSKINNHGFLQVGPDTL